MARYIVHGTEGDYDFQSVPNTYEGSESEHVIELSPEVALDLHRTNERFLEALNELEEYESRLANDPELRVKKKPSVPS